MRSKRVIISLLCIIIFSFSLFSGCSKQSEEVSEVPSLNIAFNIPMTGPYGIYGQTIRDGALMALDTIKEAGENFKLNLDLQDNAGIPSNAVSIFRKQLLKPVDIYVSGIKPQSMAIFDQVSAKGLPHFVWIFDAYICKNNKNTFRTWVSYKYEPVKYMQYIRHLNPEKISIIYVNLPHAEEEFKEILIPDLQKEGIGEEQIMLEAYEMSEKDFKNIAAKIRRFNPDLIILNGFQETIVGLVKALRAYKMIQDGNVIGTYDMLDAANLLSKEELEDIRLIAPLFNIEKESVNIKNWKEKFMERYNREPLYTDAYSYDMIQILADVAKRIQRPKTSESIIKAIQDTDLPGITGRLKFDEDGDLDLSLRIGVFRDGKIVVDDSEKTKD